MIKIDLVENLSSGHNDLVFEMSGLGIEKKLDSYYFAAAIEPKTGLNEIKTAIIALVSSWKSRIDTLKEGEIIHLPIDFSDQHTGCIQLEKQDDLKLSYGWSKKAGYAVDPINPINYFDSIEDFKPDNQMTISVKQEELAKNLDAIITNLMSNGG